MTPTRNQPLRDRLRESYNRSAPARDSSAMQEWKIKERSDFAALLKQEQGHSLLEIGAGAGHDGKFFLDLGLQPVCIDLSPAMVALCRQKGLDAYVMDIADLHFPPASFDAVYAMNSLLHLPRVELPAVLNRVHQLLKPGGLFYFGVYGGYDHEGVWEEDTYRPKRFFSFFTDEHLVQQASAVFDLHNFHPVPLEPASPIHFQSLILRRRAG
jgi:SAM-dependent methyltransferase